jgi:proline dehydrogenase
LGYNIGIKLVRGAYMNEERQLAKDLGYESPIWDSIEETHKCYNDNLHFIIEKLDKNDMLFVASHNVDSVEIAKKLVEQRDIKDGRVRFGQLKAFSD